MLCNFQVDFAHMKFNCAQIIYNWHFANVKLNLVSDAEINFKDMKYISHLIYMLEKRIFIDVYISKQFTRKTSSHLLSNYTVTAHMVSNSFAAVCDTCKHTSSYGSHAITYVQ